MIVIKGGVWILPLLRPPILACLFVTDVTVCCRQLVKYTGKIVRASEFMYLYVTDYVQNIHLSNNFSGRHAGKQMTDLKGMNENFNNMQPNINQTTIKLGSNINISIKATTTTSS